MQSSFEVIEWESTSKEQDYLVQRLFGEISDFTASKTSALHSSNHGDLNNADKRSKVAPKGERRKDSNDEEISKNSKKKRKDKREKNKFKKSQDLEVTSQLTDELTQGNQSETRISVDCDERVNSANEANGNASVLYNGKDATTTGKPKDKRKDKRPKNKFNTEGNLSSGLTENPEGASRHRVNQVKLGADLDSSETVSAEFDENELSEELADSKMKKDQKKRKQKKEGSEEVMGQGTEKKRKTDKEEELGSFVQTEDDSVKVTNRSPASQNKLSLHEKMTKQLESSRFRWINEQLYTSTGDKAVTMFAEDPGLFDIYHRGFTNQVKLWPVNPVDKIIEWLQKRPSSDVVADFGCGEAVIAQSVTNKVHSFDLVAKNKFVTACNMAKVPLNPGSVDVAVFCLSLMGTNLEDFLREAHRVLKLGGVLKVAEVTSRVSDTTEFTKSLSRLGFKLQKEDSSNKMFVLFDFVKDRESVKAVSSHKLEGLKLKPCIYKKR